MRTLATIIFAAILGTITTTAKADSSANLMFNTVIENGLTTQKNVYENHGGILRNHALLTYKYDRQNRVTEAETRNWIDGAGTWEKAVLLRYEYNEGRTTTYTYGWDRNAGCYELVKKEILEN